MKKPAVSILLAVQRSGTNFLRGVLDGHPKLDCFPEIFQDAKPGEDPMAGYRHGISPFWEFYRNRLREDPMTGLPGNRQTAVRDYFNQIATAAESADRSILLDVKFNSLHHMDGLWRGPTSPPEMLKFFAAEEYPIICLIRKNPVRVAVSLIHAMETKQYVATGDQRIRSRVITPDPVRFHHLLKGQMKNRAAVRQWLRRSDHVLEVFYEDLLAPDSPNGFNEPAFQEIHQFLGLEEQVNFQARTKRTTARPLSEVLGNYDAIQKRLAGTEFECYLDDPAGPIAPENAVS